MIKSLFHQVNQHKTTTYLSQSDQRKYSSQDGKDSPSSRESTIDVNDQEERNTLDVFQEALIFVSTIIGGGIVSFLHSFVCA